MGPAVVVVVAGLVTTGVTTLAAALYKALTPHHDPHRAARKVAEELGLVLQPHSPMPQLRATVDGQDMLVAYRSGPTSGGETRVIANTPYTDFELMLRPRGVASSIKVPAVLARMETGYSTFDRRFLVATNDPSLARLWLDWAVRTALERVPAYAWVVRRDTVTASRPGYESEARSLREALEATARLAARGPALARQWQELGEKLGRLQPDDDGTWPTIILEQGALTIRIELELGREDGGGTEITAQPGKRKWERFSVGKPKPEWANRIPTVVRMRDLPQPVRSAEPAKSKEWLREIRAPITSLPPCGLSFDGQVVLLAFADAEMNESTLRRGVDLVAEMCRRMGGEGYR